MVLLVRATGRRGSKEGGGADGLLTWSRPLSSRSPLSFTHTTSSSSRRTRSSGSDTALPSSRASAISGLNELHAAAVGVWVGSILGLRPRGVVVGG